MKDEEKMHSRRLNDLAMRLLVDRKFDAALVLFDLAIRETSVLWVKKARCLMDMGRFKAALESYKTALRLDHDSPELLIELGRVMFKLGMFKEAIAYFEGAMQLDPGFRPGLGWFNKACAYSAMEKKGEALASLKKAFEMNPEATLSALETSESFDRYRNDHDFRRLVGLYRHPDEGGMEETRPELSYFA